MHDALQTIIEDIAARRGKSSPAIFRRSVHAQARSLELCLGAKCHII